MGQLTLWEGVEIPVGACGCWGVGALSIWAEHYEQAWHILSRYEPSDVENPVFSLRDRADKPTSEEWKHYAVKEGPWALPSPAMMDRPVIVRPDRALILPPAEKVRFFIALPLWFRLDVGSAPEPRACRRLLELPTRPAANAWFGDPISGEQCYYLNTRLFTEIGDMETSPAHVVCPLWIQNDADRDLSFDRFCLHTDFLSIHRDGTRLWTNEVTILFKGLASAAQVIPARGAPDLVEKTTLVTEARHAMESSYFKRSFDLLKTFTGF